MAKGEGRFAAAAFLALLLTVTAAGLGAQAGGGGMASPAAVQGADRPMRSRHSAYPPGAAAPSPLPAPPSPLLTAEALGQPLVRHYIERYTHSTGVQWLNSVIKNGSVYLPYVKDEIARRGLPPELAYLPFIESGYLGTARSKSGAVGIWQFMLNSISPFGLKVNEMVDERRDFRKSTDAALRKLADNYRILNNWPLALAAYNAGLGAANRAVQRGKTSDYWRLCEKNEFKTETVHYVPKLLAVAHVLSNPRRYGIDFWPETTEWTVLKPARQASLDLIASETGTDRGLLYRLNLELLHGITPPDSNYELKVPLAKAEMIAAILDRAETKLLRYYYYNIQYGDTLSALSRHYGISLALIEQHNPGITNRYLKIGETIVIPALRETTPYTGGTAPETGPSPAGGTAPRPFAGTHEVVKGDTLWSLALHYRVDPQVLARENNMELNQILSIGKILKVPIIEERN